MKYNLAEIRYCVAYHGSALKVYHLSVFCSFFLRFPCHDMLHSATICFTGLSFRSKYGMLFMGSCKIRYLDKSGKKMQGHYYTPDFLVLRTDSVCFEEWKHDTDLKRLAAQYPFRYQQQEDGSWRCPPAEEAIAPLGLTFRVRSSSERRIALSSRVHSSNCCDACRWNVQPNGGSQITGSISMSAALAVLAS
jgi:hypothetical protein